MNTIDSEYLIDTMAKSIKKKQEHDSRPSEQSVAGSSNSHSIIDNEAYDILQRLYFLDRNYSMSFDILTRMKSKACFDYFEKPYQGFNRDSLYTYLIKLLEINVGMTVHHLFLNKDHKEKIFIVNKCIDKINSER